MYQNMTREEMIQRLYEGNFTTGELERQLIAKLFEQCCGGGSGSSGGGAFVVHFDEDPITGERVLDKTAAEILEASKTMPIAVIGSFEDDHYYDSMYSPVYSINKSKETGSITILTALHQEPVANPYMNVIPVIYNADNDNDYPKYSPSGSGDGPTAN